MSMPVDKLESLASKLAVLNENILVEAAHQPTLFLEAIRYRVETMRHRAYSIRMFEFEQSSLSTRLRSKLLAAGEKVTEAGLRTRVETSKGIRVLRRKVDQAYEEEELAKGLVEAYRMRRDAIRIIAESQIAEGKSESSELERVESRRRLHNEARRIIDKRQGVKRNARV